MDWRSNLTSIPLSWPGNLVETKDSFDLSIPGVFVHNGPYGNTQAHTWTFKSTGYANVVLEVNLTN